MSRTIQLLALLVFSSTIYADEEFLKTTTVTVTPITELLFFPQKSVPARVIHHNLTMIPARLAEVLLSIHVDVGDEVKKGESLAEFDCETARLELEVREEELEQAEIRLAFSKRELERAEGLRASNNIRVAELDRVKMEASQAASVRDMGKLGVARSRILVERCQVIAPFSGLVVSRQVSEGEFVNIGQPILQLLALDRVKLSAEVPINMKEDFAQADKFLFVSNQQEYQLNLLSLLPFIKERERSLEARFTFQEKLPVIGETGRLIWQAADTFLPAHLLQERAGRQGFFVFDRSSKRAIFQTVETAQIGRPFKYRAADDQDVIIDGRYSLSDQQLVQIAVPSAP